MAVIPLIVVILTVLPWALMIHQRESDFWNFFFWNEHVRRFLSDKAQHSEGFWFFVPVIIGGSLPWAVFLPAIISGLKNVSFKDSFIRFAVCWLAFPFLFFSASRGKLITYILPCFPPLAILMTVGLLRYSESGKEKAFRIGVLAFAGLTAGAALGLIGIQLTDFTGIKAYSPAETRKWIMAVIGLSSWAAVSLLTLRVADFRKKLLLYSFAPAVFLFTGHFIMPDLAKNGKAPGEFLLFHQQRIRPDTILVSDEDVFHAICWFYKRTDVYLLLDGGELNYGLSYADSEHRVLYPSQLQELVSHGKPAVLITKAKTYRRYRHFIPTPAFKDIRDGFVFAQFSGILFVEDESHSVLESVVNAIPAKQQ